MKANLSNDAVVRNLPLADKPYYCMSDDKKEKGFGVLVYPCRAIQEQKGAPCVPDRYSTRIDW